MGLEKPTGDKGLFMGKTRLRALLVLMGMLVCAQLVNGGLTLLSFQGLQLEATNASFEAVGIELQKSMERSLRFGKSLEKFIGAESLLEQTRTNFQDLENIAVSTLDGRILYSLKPEQVGQILAGPLLGLNRSPDGEKTSLRVKVDEDHYVILPLRGRAETPMGFLALSYSGELLKRKSAEIFKNNLRILAIITTAATLMLYLGFQWLFAGGRRPSKKKLYFLIFMTAGCAQFTYSYFNISQFKTNYLEVTRQKIETTSGFLIKEIGSLLDRGMELNNLVNIEEQLSKTADGIPEVSRIFILDANKRQIAGSYEKKQADKGKVDKSAEQEDRYDLIMPILSNQEKIGYLKIDIANEVIHAKTREITLDNLTVVALSFLFLMEILIFLFITVMRNAIPPSQGATDDRFLLIRPTIAIYIYAATLCYSFIPLYMNQIYQPILNFSKSFVVGLPISVEMLCGGIALIPVGHWIDRRGWHQPFITGIALSLVGSVMSGLAGSAVEFIVYRGLTGLGYGFCWMSAQGFILANSGKNSRTRALSSVFAGIFSGIICGSAMGGMLAERIGFSGVFFVAAAIMFVALLFVLGFMRSFFKVSHSHHAVDHFNRGEILRLFFDRNIFLIFTCSVIPYSICMVGVLYYICPIYLKQLGTSQSTIGRVIMLYGLCMVYLGPQFSLYADRVQNKKLLISLGGFLGSVGMLIFYYFEGIWAVVLAVLVLGISVSVSSASRNIFTIDQTISKKVGMSKVMGVYRTVDKIGQTLGPILLGLLLIRFDIRQSVGILGGVYTLMTLLFVSGVRSPQSDNAISESLQ